MKINLVHSAVLFVFVCFVSLSCNSGINTGNGTGKSDSTICDCDSMAITKKYLTNHKPKGLFPDEPMSFYFGKSFRPPGGDSVDQMLEAYKQVSFNIPNPRNNGRVHGFILDSVDFKTIINDAANYKTLSFYFGIRNFKEYKTEGPLYTIIVVPVWKPAANGASRAPANTLGYDFVDPCPGSPGCPKP